MRSRRRSPDEKSGRVVVLDDNGAPPLLGYALACSLAWHTRTPVLLLFVADHLPDDLAAFASVRASMEPPFDLPSATTDARAHLILASPTGSFDPLSLSGTVDELAHTYSYVLVQMADETPKDVGGRQLTLVGVGASLPADSYALPGHTIQGWTREKHAPRPEKDGVLRVPPLADPDTEALLVGTLPANTPAGQALGWAARYIAGLKVGLALGAGSEKGYAHIGVLRVLEREGVPIDYVAGTSIGSGVGTLVAMGRNPEEIGVVVDKVGGATFRPGLPTAGFLSNAGLRAGLQTAFGDTRFEDLDMPLAVVAADLTSGREVIFQRGLIWPALLASMSIPGVYPAVGMGPFMLVDGGILNPVPSNVVAGLGADVVVAVKLSTPSAIPVTGATTAAIAGRPPSVFQAVTRSIEIMQSKIFSETAATATILIEPLFSRATIVGWGLRKFTQGRAYEAVGEQAAEIALSQIASVLPWIHR